MVVLGVAGIFGASAYYSSERGQGCARLPRDGSYVSDVHDSPHRTVGCMECHDAGLATKLRHIWVHLTGRWPESIRLREVDVVDMVPSCQQCHQHEYASWHAGPHSATYARSLPIQRTTPSAA